MLVVSFTSSILNYSLPIYAGCHRWIFSTLNCREFCKTGKVVEPHFGLVILWIAMSYSSLFPFHLFSNFISIYATFIISIPCLLKTKKKTKKEEFSA